MGAIPQGESPPRPRPRPRHRDQGQRLHEPDGSSLLSAEGRQRGALRSSGSWEVLGDRHLQEDHNPLPATTGEGGQGVQHRDHRKYRRGGLTDHGADHPLLVRAGDQRGQV